MTLEPKTLAIAVALTALLLPALSHRAQADVAQQQSFGAWRQMTDCAHQAAIKFPDHTPQGNAQREAARQECLRQHHLPVTPVVNPAVSQPSQ